MLFSEPKIPQSNGYAFDGQFLTLVSVLFSEPKIPQFFGAIGALTAYLGFSALQRAENSSIFNNAVSFSSNAVSVLFSEPKIPQYVDRIGALAALIGFSALQRAENSSIVGDRRAGLSPTSFQCSSASRKFLNQAAVVATSARNRRFQCSSASRKFLNCCESPPSNGRSWSFSALQRAENSSISGNNDVTLFSSGFQCSSASRKFLNVVISILNVNVNVGFQCSSASRKFLN